MNRFSLIMLDYTPHKNFVKDTNNILSINAWSAGEYNDNLTYIDNGNSRNGLFTILNNYSSIGEKSIKVKHTSSRYWINILFNGLLNNTYGVSINIYNPNNTTKLTLRTDEDVISTVNIPKNNNWQTIKLTGTLTSDNDTYIRILNDNNTGSYLYLDNINIKEIP